jgi:tetratricopeptide (TPR) repeat protein
MTVRRLLLGLGLTVLVVGGVLGYFSVARERAYRQLIAQGNAAVEADRTFEAIEAFSGAIAVKGESMLAYLRRGETYRRQGQLAAAERDLRRASSLDPTATRPREALGDVHFELRNYARAVESYADFIRLDDQSPRVLYKLALARYRGGDPGGAVEPLRQAVALDERFAEGRYLLGLCLRATNRSSEALGEFERAVRAAPSLVVAREELADLYREIGRPRDALEQLETLTALDTRPTRFVTLGLEYARAGQASQAIRTLGAAAERYPEHPAIYTALGRVWLESAQNGRDRIALSKALEALQSVPTDSDQGAIAQTLFGRALLVAGDADLAERVLQEAVTRFPIEPQAFLYLADAAERAGHLTEARLALLKYLALTGQDPDPAVHAQRTAHLGDLSMRLSDPAGAVRWFTQAAGADGPNAPLLGRLAEAQAASGDRDGARQTIRRALELEPRNRRLIVLSRRLG